MNTSTHTMLSLTDVKLNYVFGRWRCYDVNDAVLLLIGKAACKVFLLLLFFVVVFLLFFFFVFFLLFFLCCFFFSILDLEPDFFRQVMYGK